MVSAATLRFANLLVKDRQAFDTESAHWHDYPRMMHRCRAAMQLIDEQMRLVLVTDDDIRAENWHRAAVLTLHHLHLSRAFRDHEDRARA